MDQCFCMDKNYHGSKHTTSILYTQINILFYHFIIGFKKCINPQANYFLAHASIYNGGRSLRGLWALAWTYIHTYDGYSWAWRHMIGWSQGVTLMRDINSYTHGCNRLGQHMFKLVKYIEPQYFLPSLTFNPKLSDLWKVYFKVLGSPSKFIIS